MQVLVTWIWHIIIKNDVDSFNVNTSTKNICCNHYSRFKALKLFKLFYSFFLAHSAVNTDCWKAVFNQKFCQCSCSESRLNKYNNLVERKWVEQIGEFSVLLILFEFTKILLKPMKRQTSFVVDMNLKWSFHKLFTNLSHILFHGCAVHLNLLVVWSEFKNILNILSHI